MVLLLKKIFFNFLFFIPAMGLATAEISESDFLKQGSLALEQNNLPLALSYFKSIPMALGDQWEKKVVLLMRYQFLKKDYLEVWRLGQILLRTQHKNKEAQLLTKTALYKMNVCILDFDSTYDAADDLLLAATYRFPGRYTPQESLGVGTSMQRWNSGHRDTSLSLPLPFYLTEISEAAPLVGSGCSGFQFSIKNKVKSQKNELTHIIDFLHSTEANKILDDKSEDIKVDLSFANGPFQTALLLARAIELLQINTKDLSIIHGELKKMGWQILLSLPEPERRLLWTEKNLLSPLNQTEKEKFILDLIIQSEDPRSADWLSLIDLQKLAPQKQILILEHLIQYENLAEREYILFALARVYWGQRNLKRTLQILRMLMVDREDFDSPVIRESVLTMTTNIFAELKWDESSLGAFQATLPKSLWLAHNRKLLNELAYRGDFKRLEIVLKRKSMGRIKDDEIEALRTIALRDLIRFKRIYTKVKNRNSAFRKMQTIIDDLASVQFSLTTSQTKELEPFHKAIIELLKEQVESPENQETEHLQQLIFIFSRNNISSPWQNGNATIRNGIVEAGTVGLTSQKELPNPFRFKTIAKPLPRDLIFVPTSITGNKWILAE